MADLGLEKGNKGANLFERRRLAAEQSALIKGKLKRKLASINVKFIEGEASKSDAVNTTRSTFQVNHK